MLGCLVWVPNMAIAMAMDEAFHRFLGWHEASDSMRLHVSKQTTGNGRFDGLDYPLVN